MSFDIEFSSFWVSRSFDLGDLGDLEKGPWNVFKNYIFEISAFHWSKCTIECAIYSILILKSAQARGALWIRKPPLDPGNPPNGPGTPHGSCLSLYLAHAYVLGSRYCIWLMLNIQAYITYLYLDFSHANLAHAHFSQSKKTHEPRTCCTRFPNL